MSSITISFIVLACVFGGALFGIFLHAVLPQHHLSNETKDIVKLGMGLVGTMAALVLGLLVASAKGYYDTQGAEVTQLAANVALLDRVLAHYGPETKEPRTILRVAVGRAIDQMWPKENTKGALITPSAAGGEILLDKIQQLPPTNDMQRSLQGQASSIAMDIGKDPLVDVRPGDCRGILFVTGRAGSLAHSDFYQFRPLRPFQRDCRFKFIRFRTIGFGRNFFDPGNVHALHRSD